MEQPPDSRSPDRHPTDPAPEPASTPPPHPSSATYIVEPTTTHTHSFVFLHGLGDNGRNFGAQFLEAGHTSTGHLVPQLLPGARFIFPTAPLRRASGFKWTEIQQGLNPQAVLGD
ncbi:uncharacterized protein B0I36DRAFT_368746 [Microdochium trichocladiopsis]|uniref:Phospholipase/carboxylesterase/thioesterase domain-containing protein n=1 Tax=Microdochium trichocladiopsis TaxID=1682393 RepID=A0A9P9BIX5_9PEZI|nr:uncharacterized protein B0I36DRAFT_368746 [Microdochium trichocladiopsis]KAH7016133.1 hypothetical protein B0I36DRAFT_368746 [Microdochium trichocladiopsis]